MKKIEPKRKIKIVFEEEGGSFMYDKMIDYYKFKHCGADIDFFAVLYSGDIVNCLQNDRDNLKIEGNILKDRIKTIWQKGFK